MKIGFVIGELEEHQMELSFDQKSGDLRILMDGAPVLEDHPLAKREPVRAYELNIGEAEKHRLVLQLGYGEEPVEAGIQAPPRLSLMVSPVVEQERTVQESLGLNASNHLFAASAAAPSSIP